jgi:hypothetical protein
MAYFLFSGILRHDVTVSRATGASSAVFGFPATFAGVASRSDRHAYLPPTCLGCRRRHSARARSNSIENAETVGLPWKSYLRGYTRPRICFPRAIKSASRELYTCGSLGASSQFEIGLSVTMKTR